MKEKSNNQLQRQKKPPLKPLLQNLTRPITILLTLISQSLPVGVIDSDITLPISNTLANEDEYADYTFRFNLTTKLLNGGYIEVIFPNQFESGLGIPLLPNCTLTCTRFERTVNFYFEKDLYPSVIYNMTIREVKNPPSIGGTGNFIIRSKRGANTLDESMIFGILGVGGGIGNLTSTTVAVDDIEGAQAGEISKYVFSFKTDMFLYPNIYLKFYLPKGAFDVSENPSCSSFEINGALVPGNFYCNYSQEFETIEVRGFTNSIQNGGEVGISVSMRNPKYSFTTGTFDIVVFKEGTTMAYTRKLTVQGIQIIAGKITQISILPVDSSYLISKQKLMWFRLKFKPTNPLNSGAVIRIKIPDSMTLWTLDVLGRYFTFYVEKGIEDISDDNPMKISYEDSLGSRYIKIENFQPQTQPNLVQVIMLITLPNSNGPSLPFEIRTYTSSSLEFEIDRDLSTARITVEDVGIPQGHSIQSSVSVADGSSLTDLSFKIQAGKSIAAYGSFKILVDERLETAGVDKASCKIWSKNDKTQSTQGSIVDSYACSKKDREIEIKLDYEPYSLGFETPFQLNQVIKSPKIAGTYYIEIQTISPQGQILESYTESLTFSATPLISPKIECFPKYSYQLSMHEIVFNTPYRIEASKIQESSSDLVSFLQIEYRLQDPLATEIKSDLATGITTSARIPCKSLRGLQPITGYNINCTFYTGAVPTIRITNFKIVAVGENVKIFIPDLENPGKKFKATIRIVTKQNRLFTEISNVNAEFEVATFSTAIADITTDVNKDTGFYDAITSKKVSSDFSIDFKVKIHDTFVSGSRIYFKFPRYDTGFIPEEGHVTCGFDDARFNCYQYSEIGLVYGQLASDQSIVVEMITTPPASEKYSRTYLYNLRWPRYVPAGGSNMTIEMGIIKSDGTWHYRLIYPTLDLPEANALVSSKLNVDKKRKKEVDSTYTFTFVPTNNIPEGATVVLTLPEQYNLIASSPRVTISYPEFQDISSTKKVTHTYTSRQITINNMAQHPEKVQFRIIIKGVRNPDYSNELQGFKISILLNSLVVNEKDDFLRITLSTNPFTPGVILIDKISLFPTNNLAYSDYTFSFTPQTKLSVGSEIHIVYPSDYINLPQSPDCTVTGGIQTFESCESLGNEIIIRLDTAYITDVISIRVKNVQNPGNEKTQAFEIYTFYDGSIVDETNSETSSFRQIELSEVASLISMREFYFDPVNEGEIANYVISFIPTNNIDADMEIYIKFPDSFDLRLGKKVDIFVTSGLEGDIQTSIVERMVVISNFNAYEVSPDSPIKVELSGVVNPNKPLVGHSGYISVGALKKGNNRYQDYLEQAAVVETVSSPGWLTLHNITTSSNYSRMGGNYTINVTVNNAVPKSDYEGKIYIDLPEQFELRTGILKCKNLTANLGINLRCNINKRTISLNGHPDELSSNIGFTIFDILNPLEEISSHTLFVRSYDGFNREIIQRSFENLDPFKFSYEYPGPLIIVNEDKPIYVERGTQSRDLYIHCTEIMALNLSFIPATAGFTFVPSPLEMKIGQNKTKFRVSVPMGFEDGSYYVEWVTKGDLSSPIYTPIRKSLVIITKKGNVPVEVEEINDIPIGGNSLPIKFTTEYAPDIGIEILVKLQNSYNGLELSTPSSVFNSGDNTNSFKVFFTDKNIQEAETIQSGVVTLELIGVNKEVFNLAKKSLKFNIKVRDTRPPEITDIQTTATTRNSISFTFVCSDIATAYAIIALKGTEKPSWEELKAQGPPEFETTETQYAIYDVGKELTGNGYFEGLTAETEYVVYVFLEDRGENQIEAPGSVEFKTNNRNDAAFVELRFRQTYINSAERELIATRVAFLLSLLPFKVEEKKYEFGVTLAPGTTRRALQKETLEDVTSTITLTVLASPESPVYPAPIELAKLLRKTIKKKKMAETFSNYDTDFTINPYNFTRYEIGFSAIPTITGVGSDIVNISANLDNYGFIYAIAVTKTESLGKPTPFQISRGLDYRNIPLPSGAIEANQKFVLFNFNVTDLDPDTDYNLYMTAGSAHPGYPDLMSETNTVFLEFKTLKAEVIPKLSLENGFIGKVAWVLFAGVVWCWF